MSDEEGLPEGWCWAKLGELLMPGGLFDGPFGSNLKTSDYTDSGVRVIRLENLANLRFVEEKRTFISEEKYSGLSKHTVREGDILVGSFIDGNVRVCRLPALDTVAIAKADCFCVRPNPNAIDARFIVYQLGSEKAHDALLEHIHGATRPRITTKQLRGLDVMVPPLMEQRRIVAAVERVLERVASARERLERVSVILKQFRQAVLAAACSGRLTAEWGQTYEHDGLSPGDDLPTTWRRVRLGDIIDGLKYGTSKKSDYLIQGVPVLRIPNIGDGFVTHEAMKYADLERAEYEQLRLRDGDVLMIRSNGSVTLLGKTALVGVKEHDFAYAGYLIRIRPNRSEVRPAYLNVVLTSREVRDQIEVPARSTSGVNNINSDEVRSLELPLPPLAEQDAIVSCVYRLFTLADSIEERATSALRRVESLTPAVLSKAFRGELVSTEAELARREGRSYQTASELLVLARLNELGNGETKRAGAKKTSKRAAGTGEGLLEFMEG